MLTTFVQREELEDLGQRYSRKDLQKLEDEEDNNLFNVDSNEGNLLNRKERRLLIYDDKGKPRSVQSIIGLLSRRVDYVERSVKSVVALLATAEEDLARLDTSLKGSPESSQPSRITEIQEELDENGNVISSKTTHPGETAADVLQSIQHDIAESTTANADVIKPSIEDVAPSTDPRRGVEHRDENDPLPTASPSRQRSRSDSKKRVSFAADTKPEHDTSEHPVQLPKDEQLRLLQSACSQLRQQLGKNVAVHKIETLNGIVPSVSLVEGSNIDIASQILRMQQNRQAKRLLKAEDLDLKGAANILCKMAELSIYDIESPQLLDAVSHARETRSVASSSRESSPGVLSDGFPSDTPDTSLSSSPLASAKDHTHLIGSLPDSDVHDVQNPSGPKNVVRNDDTPEEAAIRRQMLQYSMNEVGAVVAELNLEEDDEEDGLEEMDLDIESNDSDENEDEHGRTITQVVNGDYVAEMRALEAKLNAKAMINAGPEKTANLSMQGPVAQDDVSQKPTSPKRSGSAKGVHFAEEIEIQEAPSHSPIQQTQTLERKRPLAPEAPDVPRTKKPSRFKAARTKQQATVERNDENATSKTSSMKETPIGSRPIVERETPSMSQPLRPDDTEPAFMQHEVRNEYHRLRNRLISQQGGFSKRNELDEDDSEGEYEVSEAGKKVSRFRAARLDVR